MNQDMSKWDFLSKDEKNAEAIVRYSLTYWQDVWRRLKRNKVAVLSLYFLIILVVATLIIPAVWKYSILDQDLNNAFAKPSGEHYFGTDNLGRDLFVRVLYGARISLIVGIAASLINATVGILYGSISGYLGGRVDNMMMRVVDVLYSVPLTLVVILIMVRFEQRGLQTILLAIGLTYWIGMARLVRGQIMALKNEEYVLAARTLGASDKRILVKHLIPNALGPIVINLTMSIPSAIFTESFLAFIGIGLAPPLASLGTLCYASLGGYQIHPHMLLAPAGVLCVMMLAFNFLGDGLRDALDPKMRR